jgi:serine/threonine-protein kinase
MASDGDVTRTLAHVLSSRSFARAEQLRRLLAYIVETAVAGRESTLKETVIGVDVFDLPPDFDPKSDPIVRIEMRRLRNRLRQYYESEGASDPYVINLEPGSYVPRFGPKAKQSPQKVSIAVLPFESASEDSADSDCAGLVREALLTRLSSSAVLRLAAQDSVLPLRDAGLDVRAIGERLRVHFVVRGACVSNEDRIRVRTELVRTADGQMVWSGTHEQDASAEIWTIQNVIASELEKPALAEAGGPQRVPDRTSDGANGLYRLLVQGRHYLNQTNVEALKKSAACFAAAAEIHPASAKAWAGVSVTHTCMVMYHAEPAAQGWQSARVAAEKSIALDPSIAETHLAMGFLTAFADFRPAMAGEYFQRALALNPDDNAARLVNALTHLAPLGKLQEAEDQLELVLSTDPLNAKGLQMLAVVLYFQRRYSAAIDVALSARDVLPANAITAFVLANAYDRLERHDDALREFRRWEESMPFMRPLQWSTILSATYKGRAKWVRPAALAAARLLRVSTRVPLAMVADLMVRLGEYDKAISFMERAFEERAFRAMYLAVDPVFDPIRSDPRCVRLLESLSARTRSAQA